MNSLDGEIGDGKHRQQVRVYYEDTDFSGIVYHASYLRFMERGRTNYLRLIGADHRALFEQAAAEAPGFAFVVRHMDIHFHRPAHMDDVLDVVTAPDAFPAVKAAMEAAGLAADIAEVTYRADNDVAVSGEIAQQVAKLLRWLEDMDDVQSVHSNADLGDAAYA